MTAAPVHPPKRVIVLPQWLAAVIASALISGFGAGFGWAWNTNARLAAIETEAKFAGRQLEEINRRFDRFEDRKITTNGPRPR